MAAAPCGSPCCDLLVYDDPGGECGLLCVPGTRCDCFEAQFATRLSINYPSDLAAVMQKLSEALKGFPTVNGGRRLAFVRTPHGLVLAWVTHHNVVTDPAKISSALGLDAQQL